MSEFKNTLEYIRPIETWAEAPREIKEQCNNYKLSYLAVLNPSEIESGVFVKQVLKEIFAMMPPDIVIKMLVAVMPTNEPIKVYKTDDTIVFAYRPPKK